MVSEDEEDDVEGKDNEGNDDYKEAMMKAMN